MIGQSNPGGRSAIKRLTSASERKPPDAEASAEGASSLSLSSSTISSIFFFSERPSSRILCSRNFRSLRRRTTLACVSTRSSSILFRFAISRSSASLLEARSQKRCRRRHSAHFSEMSRSIAHCVPSRRQG